MKKVVKFGGSSLASAEQFVKVGNIIHADEDRKFVVPSAPGKRFDKDTKVTDMLYACYALAERDHNFNAEIAQIEKRYQEIIDGLKLDLDLSSEFDRIIDNFKRKAGANYAASRGEYLNGIIMAEYLGYEFVDPAEAIRFNEAGVFDADATQVLLSKRLEGVERAVIPGFYGSIVAKAIQADVYENWTDVSGFLIADPRIIENPKGIDTITYGELRELSYMGAGVLHEDAIFPVRKQGIPINIRNTNQPEDEGTWIVGNTCKKSKYTITGIAGKKGFASINIEKDMMNAEIGFGRKVLQVFEEYDISFEHMPSGIDTLNVMVHQTEFADKEQNILSGISKAVNPDHIEIQSDLALIAVVGRCMKSQRGTVGRIFAALAHANVNVRMIDQGSSEQNVIIGVSNFFNDTATTEIYTIFVETRV